MRKLVYSLYLAIVITSCISKAYSKVPPGFESFYELKEEVIEVSLLGKKIELIALANVEKVVVDDNSQIAELTKVIEEVNISAWLKDKIVSDARQGFTKGLQCETENCDYDNFIYEVKYDDMEKTLTLFVRPEYLISASERPTNYYQGLFNGPSIINKLDLYASSNNISEVNNVVYLDSNIAFLNGFTNLEASYDQTSNINLNKLSHTFHMQGYKLDVGYYKKSYIDPGLMNVEERYIDSKYKLALTNSDLLSLDKDLVTKTLDFYSPIKGSLRVVRGEKIILQTNVDQGYGSIDYARLERGVYEVSLEFYTEGTMVHSYTYFVNNSSDTKGLNYEFSLEELHVAFGSGFLANSKEKDLSQVSFSLTNNLTDKTVVGSGFKLDEHGDTALSLSTSTFWGDSTSSNIGISYYNNGDIYSLASLTLQNLNIDYQRFATDVMSAMKSRTVHLSNFNHGFLSSQQLTASILLPISSNLVNTSGISYSSWSGNKTYNAFSQLSYQVNNSVDLTLGLELNRNDLSTITNRDGSVNFSVNILLPNGWRSRTLTNISRNDSVILQDIAYDTSLGELQTQFGVKSTLSDYNEHVGTLYSNGRINSEKFGASYNIGITRDSSSFNGHFSTQVAMSEAGFIVDDSDSDSYVVIKNKAESIDSDLEDDKLYEPVGILTLHDSNSVLSTQPVILGSDNVFQTKTYTEYRLEENMLSSAHILEKNMNEGEQIFTLPGSVHHYAVDITSVDSRLYINNDARVVECYSDTCIDAVFLADGVYRIYAEKDQFPTIEVDGKVITLEL